MLRTIFIAFVSWLVLASGVVAGTLERIRDNGVFKIGYREDTPPFSYKNSIGERAGYSLDLCRAVAAQIKKELGLAKMSVKYVSVTAEDRFKAVQSGRVDLLCGATTATLDRRELVDFSVPTFVDGASVLLRRGGPQTFGDLAGKKVGVRAGTTTEEALRNTLADLSMKVETVAVKDHKDGLNKLLNSKVSAYFADRAILYHLAAASGSAKKLQLSKQQFTYEPYALALQRGDSAFRLAVDRVLSRLYRSGKIRTIFGAAFGHGSKPTGELSTLYRISALPE